MPAPTNDQLKIDKIQLNSRFLLGTAGYPSPQTLADSIKESGAQIITVGLKRQLAAAGDNGFIEIIKSAIKQQNAHLLPNTAGCTTAREAIQLSHMARELYGTSWIKLEVVGDEYTLQPDQQELITAAAQLTKDGFTVFPYCTEDLVTCKKLLDAGCPLLMPWGAPIGSGQGLINQHALKTLRNRLPTTTLIIDAGIGAPSHAAQAMEIGFDAVLLNSAVSNANDPKTMANAFKKAIQAGRSAYLSGIMPAQNFATATTPAIGNPFLIN